MYREKASNTRIEWGNYCEPNAVLESLGDPTVVVMEPTLPEFDDDIPMWAVLTFFA